MNMFKKNGGFTLVELIVVIALLAILAGIAVPAYSGYLQSAQKAGDITTLSAVKTAATAAQATTGEVSEIIVEATNGVITEVKVNNVNEDPDDATDNYITLYTCAVDASGAKTPDWKNADFKAYLYNEMPDLKCTAFQSGVTWPVNDAWDVTEAPSA